MLFHVDRQTLSVLKSTLKAEEGWTDLQYSWLVTAFMVPYTLCYLVTGQLIEALGYSTLLVLGCLLHPLAAVILWRHYRLAAGSVPADANIGHSPDR